MNLYIMYHLFAAIFLINVLKFGRINNSFSELLVTFIFYILLIIFAPIVLPVVLAIRFKQNNKEENEG